MCERGDWSVDEKEKKRKRLTVGCGVMPGVHERKGAVHMDSKEGIPVVCDGNGVVSGEKEKVKVKGRTREVARAVPCMQI